MSVALIRFRNSFSVLDSVKYTLRNMSEVPVAAVVQESLKRGNTDTLAGEADLKKTKLDEGSEGIVNQQLSDNLNEQKWKRKKYAMCLSYSGKGYSGMQKNAGVRSIEEDLLAACLKANYITEENERVPQSMQFQRAARTDKGVSALKQIVSIKLPSTQGSCEEMARNINENLVDQIRVMSIKRVTKNFNSKNNAESRSYLYVCPSFAFAPVDKANENFRIEQETIDEINRVLQFYIGTHNFHQFTSGRKFNDRSSVRVMFKIDCSSPFMVGDMEYVQIRIKGQSFMLHQIRKMVGVVIAIMKGLVKDDFINTCYRTPEKLDIPVAPALGLLLDTVHYDRYNRKYAGDGQHEPLEWDEIQDKLQLFKEKHIFPNIWETEKEEKSMIAWLEILQMHSFAVRRFEERLGTLDEGPDVADDDENDAELEREEK